MLDALIDAEATNAQAAKQPQDDGHRQTSQQFTVLSWNVLAAEFTNFNHKPPGCVQGHLNPDSKLESKAQTAARYTLTSDALLARAPDAVLLQECSKHFFSAAVNPRAPALLEQFAVAHASNEEGPGTAVLLLKNGRLASTGATFTAGGSEALTGGTSKSASAVLVTLKGGDARQRVWLCSVHLTPYKIKPEAVRTHLKLLGDALRSEVDTCSSADSDAPARVLVAGDLNAQPAEVAAIQRECAGPLSGLLHRVVSPGPTGLSANFAVPCEIDHLFLSPGLRLVSPLELERTPESPFGVPPHDGEAAPVAFASDHVWLSATVSVE